MAAQHIDHDRLYTDTVYRFKYVSEFADFGPEDIAAIKNTASVVAPLVPAIVDAVYVKLFSFDITKQVFLPRNDGFKGATATTLQELTLDHDQIRFRKDFLSKYLVKLVTADYNEAFILYLDWVGRIHTDTPKKKSKINVEYIHVNALFAWLHGFLVKALDGALDPKVRGKTLAAYSKLLWIQNDLFARYYVKDGPSSAVAASGSSGITGFFASNAQQIAVLQLAVIAALGLKLYSRL